MLPRSSLDRIHPVVYGLKNIFCCCFSFISWSWSAQNKYATNGHMLNFKIISFILLYLKGRGVMMFKTTFNNISVKSWRSVLLVQKSGVPGENNRMMQVTDKLYHIMLYRVHFDMSGFELTTLVVIGTNCIGSCKSNYQTITTTTVPFIQKENIN